MSVRVEEKIISAGIVIIPVDALSFVPGVSPAMRSLERVVADIAPTDVPILLIGESGTGKQVVALEVHRRSRHRNGPFVKCHSSALSSDSLRSYLGSRLTSEGIRDGVGTIFFDDVSRLDRDNQDLLLELLSNNDSSVQDDCWRVISSATRNLEEEIRAGRFREELYYRINGLCLRLPSLRQRPEDLPILLDHLLKKCAFSFLRPEPQVSSATMNFLLKHSWPGNIRELENFARKLVILGDEEMALSDLALNSAPHVPEPPRGGANGSKPRSLKAAAREASRSVERELILNSLERTHWNRKRTARELQISYKALLYKLKQLDIEASPDLAEESAETSS